MLRQEAIEILTAVIKQGESRESNVLCEACDMAIEALSEERESGEEKSCKGCKYLCDPFVNVCNQCTRALSDHYEIVGEEE